MPFMRLGHASELPRTVLYNPLLRYRNEAVGFPFSGRPITYPGVTGRG
jgi:hypothetical protein